MEESERDRLEALLEAITLAGSSERFRMNQEEAKMDGTTVAVDLTKRVFEVAVANERGQILDRKRYGRASFQRFLETRPPLA